MTSRHQFQKNIGSQVALFGDELASTKNKSQLIDSSSTFTRNMSLPIHRWFRFPAGFSASWVKETLLNGKKNSRTHIIDPFAGAGTVLFESEIANVQSVGLEAHPFISRITQAKLNWRENPARFREYGLKILQQARRTKPSSIGSYNELIRKSFPNDILVRLDALRSAWASGADDSPKSLLSWLALASILRECSPVGTASWQYILPNKRKAKVSDPFTAFEEKIYVMASDMAFQREISYGPPASFYLDDARVCKNIPSGWADFIITSPPYANNYDYADAMRFEMSFFKEISGWKDLHEKVRRNLIVSCTQHVASIQEDGKDVINDPLLSRIRKELTHAYMELERVRNSHGGRKTYHKMIAYYFYDMARVWKSLNRVTSNNALACFVIGDSAPYGVHVPVERWLGELALAAGFKSYSFEKIRDRNIKWKNRKHRVPLQEGRLWVKK